MAVALLPVLIWHIMIFSSKTIWKLSSNGLSPRAAKHKNQSQRQCLGQITLNYDWYLANSAFCCRNIRSIRVILISRNKKTLRRDHASNTVAVSLSNQISDRYSVFGEKSLAIDTMNVELPPFTNGKQTSESAATLDRDITPLNNTAMVVERCHKYGEVSIPMSTHSWGLESVQALFLYIFVPCP